MVKELPQVSFITFMLIFSNVLLYKVCFEFEAFTYQNCINSLFSHAGITTNYLTFLNGKIQPHQHIWDTRNIKHVQQQHIGFFDSKSIRSSCRHECDRFRWYEIALKTVLIFSFSKQENSNKIKKK